MKEKGYGRIINVASLSGFQGYKTGSLYCSTKAALIRFTESLGKDLEKRDSDVTANVICPDSFSSVEGEIYSGRDAIFQNAHGIKGAAGNLRAYKISSLARNIEKKGKDGDLTDLSSLVEELKEEFAELENFHKSI